MPWAASLPPPAHPALFTDHLCIRRMQLSWHPWFLHTGGSLPNPYVGAPSALRPVLSQIALITPRDPTWLSKGASKEMGVKGYPRVTQSKLDRLNLHPTWEWPLLSSRAHKHKSDHMEAHMLSQLYTFTCISQVHVRYLYTMCSHAHKGTYTHVSTDTNMFNAYMNIICKIRV